MDSLDEEVQEARRLIEKMRTQVWILLILCAVMTVSSLFNMMMTWRAEINMQAQMQEVNEARAYAATAYDSVKKLEARLVRDGVIHD